MLVAIAATDFEMQPFRILCRLSEDRLLTLVSGVGLLESAVTASRFLEKYHTKISAVVNFGIGGAYIAVEGTRPVNVLDICLAKREILGDFGVCSDLIAEPFSDPALRVRHAFILDQDLLDQAEKAFEKRAVAFQTGTFVTVNGASSTAARGASLHHRYQAICENMEGGAIARVCEDFSLPMVEIRAISNLVEDRPGSPWKLQEASETAARAAALIVQQIGETR